MLDGLTSCSASGDEGMPIRAWSAKERDIMARYGLLNDGNA